MAEPESPFNDSEMHRLFQTLREHVVVVLRDFTERVTAQIDALAGEDLSATPATTEVAADSLIEMSNIFVNLFRDDEDSSEDDREGETPDEDAKDD